MVPKSLVEASAFPALLKGTKVSRGTADDSDLLTPLLDSDEKADPEQADELTIGETADAADPSAAASSGADQADGLNNPGADDGSATDRGTVDRGSSRGSGAR